MELQFKEHVRIKYFFFNQLLLIYAKEINMKIVECAMNPDATGAHRSIISFYLTKQAKVSPCWGTSFFFPLFLLFFFCKCSDNQGSQPFPGLRAITALSNVILTGWFKSSGRKIHLSIHLKWFYYQQRVFQQPIVCFHLGKILSFNLTVEKRINSDN